MVCEEVNKDDETDPCGFLSISTQHPDNYTLTHFGEHSKNFSHDQINRYLGNARLTPRIVWEHVKSDGVQTPYGYIIFD